MHGHASETARFFFVGDLRHVAQEDYPRVGNWSAFFSGRNWHGVYCTDSGCELRATRVAVRQVRTRGCDARTQPGSVITFEPAGPLFVLDTAWRSNGPVPSILHDASDRKVPSGQREGWRLAEQGREAVRAAIPVDPVRNDLFAAARDSIEPARRAWRADDVATECLPKADCDGGRIRGTLDRRYG